MRNDWTSSELAAWRRKFRRLVGERIREARRAAGYTQEELAGMLHVSRAKISMWENGQRPLTVDDAVLLGRILSRPLAELLAVSSQEKEGKDG